MSDLQAARDAVMTAAQGWREHDTEECIAGDTCIVSDALNAALDVLIAEAQLAALREIRRMNGKLTRTEWVNEFSAMCQESEAALTAAKARQEGAKK